MQTGENNRTRGVTLMNATISRAHTIVTVEFKKLTLLMGKKLRKPQK